MTTEEFNIKVVGLGPKIFRFAARMVGDETLAGDIVQDVFENMWRKRLSLGRYENVEGFVMQSARNRCYDHLRHLKIVRRHSQQAAMDFTPATESAATLEKDDIRRIVRDAVAVLPTKQKEAIQLRDIEGYEFEEIAAIMDCNVEAVRVYLSRARRAVAEKLKPIK